MTLRATIKKGTYLKKIITILNNLFHKVSISISDGRLIILMITACDSMLFDVNITLDEVECDDDSEKMCTFSVNTKHFLESLNTLKANDSVTISIGENQMTVETTSQERTERSFLFVSKTQNLKVCAEPEYEDEIKASQLNLPKLCKALNNASRELVVKGNSKRFTMRANLEGMYGREVEFGDPLINDVDIEDIYLTEHFLDISKISNLGNNLYFKIKKDHPLCIEARVSDMCSFKVFIKPKSFEPESP